MSKIVAPNKVIRDECVLILVFILDCNFYPTPQTFINLGFFPFFYLKFVFVPKTYSYFSYMSLHIYSYFSKT